jgi:hypothetical protein
MCLLLAVPDNRARATATVIHASSQDVIKAAPASNVDTLKQQILQLSGSKYGHDLPDTTRQTILSKVEQLEQLQVPVKVDKSVLTGSKWTTVFTTSDGASCLLHGLAAHVRQCPVIVVQHHRHHKPY